MAAPGVLCCLGDLVEDVVVWLSGPPARGTDTPATITRHRGGSAANVAVFAAAAGVPARFVGRVGDDRTGRALVDELVAAGVDVRVQRDGRTGTIVVLVAADGERTFCTDRAAAAELTVVPTGWLAGVAWLHVPAYSLDGPCAEAAIAAARAVRAAGGRVSVSTASVAVLERLGPGALAVLEPSLVLANADEAPLAGRLDGALLVVTDGPRPTTVGGAVVPVPPVADVRDTTGAGDAFAAGFLAELLRGGDPVGAARAGHALAARVLRSAGATLER